MRSRSAFQLRAAALATAATLALGAAACGGSDDDSSGGSGSDQEQAQAQATVETLYAAIRDGDAEKVCEQMNEAAQKQLAAGGLGAKSESCTEAFQKFLDKAEKAGGLKLTLQAKVKSVEVTGDKAVAKVSFGGKGRNGEIPLEKVDGEWKLEAAGATPSN
jgi:ketosteroid isomerase-like protein